MDSAGKITSPNFENWMERVRASLKESIDVKRKILEDDEILKNIVEAVRLMLKTLSEGGKVLVFGNGGSAADAQHFVAELIGRYQYRDRPPIPAIALTTNTSNLTAIANDYGYERVFIRQLEGLLRPEDTVLGISTSGKSPNVIIALARARELGAKVIALLGRDGGPAVDLADIAIVIPANSTARIQEAHETVLHIMCEILEDSLWA